MHLITNTHWQQIESTILDLKAQIAWYKDENRKLLDRLLIKSNTTPLSTPPIDNRQPLERELIGLDDFFKEIPEDEYEKLERAKLAKESVNGAA